MRDAKLNLCQILTLKNIPIIINFQILLRCDSKRIWHTINHKLKHLDIIAYCQFIVMVLL